MSLLENRVSPVGGSIPPGLAWAIAFPVIVGLRYSSLVLKNAAHRKEGSMEQVQSFSLVSSSFFETIWAMAAGLMMVMPGNSSGNRE
jgi:hypothetical protein